MDKIASELTIIMRLIYAFKFTLFTANMSPVNKISLRVYLWHLMEFIFFDNTIQSIKVIIQFM